MNPEDFARFLEHLSPEPEEAGRLYQSLHKKLIGFFQMQGIADPENAADETIDRAVMKICAGAEVPEVTRYCRGIARNIANERHRLARRENSTFEKFVEDLSNASADQVERIYNLLKPCFERLTGEDQQLLQAYCQDVRGRARAEHRRQLAETMKTTVSALRVRVTRLRSSLTDCVRGRSNTI